MHLSMLRESCEHTSTPFAPSALTDPDADPRIPDGRTLRDLVDSLLSGGTDDDVRAARARVIAEMGAAAFVDALAVIALFQMMNRVAHATGANVSKGTLNRTAALLRAAGLHT